MIHDHGPPAAEAVGNTLMPTNEMGSFEIAIIGAGFSGLCMAIKLKERGVDDFVLFEQAEEVGGTWRDNDYPGCACDVPSHLYSFSFEQNPRWSRVYPSQPEILAYLKQCTEKYRIRSHVRFGTEITSAIFDEDMGAWHLESSTGDRFTARAVVNASGPLNRPSFPDVPGLDDFRGKTFHSSEWNHDVDLRGKRVAVVGTGASSIQFVPEIAPDVEKLLVFQRTPPWVVPRPDRRFSSALRWCFDRIPLLQRLYRNSIYWRMEGRGMPLLGKLPGRGILEKLARIFIARSIPDPALRAAVTPDYQMGCKRVLLSNDYYPALNRDNVELVPAGLARVTPDGVVGEDGREFPVDVIVFGTGFRAQEFLHHMTTLRGRNGRGLEDAWEDGADSFLGVTVSGFPNLFFLVGPNTGLGHNSMIFMIESQVHHVLKCLDLLNARGGRWIDLREHTQTRFQEGLHRQLDQSVWASGCDSWYLSDDGRNDTLWPGTTISYWLATRRASEREFEIGGQGAASRTSEGNRQDSSSRPTT